MPNLRNKVSKRKSDSFVLDNSKVQNTSAGTVLRRNVQVPIAAQLQSLKEAHAVLEKEQSESG